MTSSAGVRRGTTLAVVPVGHDDRSAPLGCAALRPLGDVPLVRRAVEALIRSGVVDAVVVVTPPALVEAVEVLVAGLPAGAPADVPVEVLGASQSGPGQQVLVALRARRPDPASIVVVQDPLFPLAPAALVRAVVAALHDAGREPDVVAVVPVRPMTDTLKRVDEHDVVVATVDREGFRMVYSPQAYRAGALVAALAAAAADAELCAAGADVLPRMVQAGGGRLSSVPAPGEVFRVGTAQDLVLAEAVLHVDGVSPSARPGP